MVKKIINITMIVCLLIANFYIPDYSVEAKTLGDLKKELEQFEQDYKDNKLQQELSEKEISEIEKQIATINDSIVSLGEEIISLTDEIEKLNLEIENKQNEIEEILSFAQISNGESAYLEYAFGAKDFTDFIYRTAIAEQLTSYNSELVDEYTNNIEENKKKTEELSNKKVKLSEQQSTLKDEMDKIKVSLESLDDLSLSIEEQIAARKSEIAIYEKKGCKDSENIATCGRQYLPSDTRFYRPLKTGYLTGWYGRRSCSDPRVSCFHNGLDMSSSGANTGNVPVYSIANGIVVNIITPKYNSSTGRYYNKCGGKQVFIQHNINGKIYTSGYLHLRSINVKVDQVVTKDTQIGIVGGYPRSGYEYYDTCSTGAHLHLEISTGTFAEGTYYAYRSAANTYINFPRSIGQSWYDRITKY